MGTWTRRSAEKRGPAELARRRARGPLRTKKEGPAELARRRAREPLETKEGGSELPPTLIGLVQHPTAEGGE
eukprot:16427413-Heterocapsa_arctica.AAC.1